MAALWMLPLQPGPWSNTVPTLPGARPTPGGTRESAADSCKALAGPGRAAPTHLSPRSSPAASRSRSPHHAPLHPPGSSRLGAHSCQRFSSALAAAARRDDAEARGSDVGPAGRPALHNAPDVGYGVDTAHSACLVSVRGSVCLSSSLRNLSQLGRPTSTRPCGGVHVGYVGLGACARSCPFVCETKRTL